MFKKLFSKRQGGTDADEGYITRLYLNKSHWVTVHDSLSAPETSEIQSDSDLFTEQHEFQGLTFSEPTFLVNPGTGLPMLDDFIDIGGNMFGCMD